jgi:hypothetical protein
MAKRGCQGESSKLKNLRLLTRELAKMEPRPVAATYPNLNKRAIIRGWRNR